MKKIVYRQFLNWSVWVVCTGTAWGSIGVYTWHYDNARTGQNSHETALTPSRMNPERFGKLFSYPVDGALYAQPLYVPDVALPGLGRRNVIYVATEHDSVYAFDADREASVPLWHVSFLRGQSTTPATSEDLQCHDITPEIGITGTPVIDSSTGILYVVAKTKEINGSKTMFVQRLHALDITTGSEKLGGPVIIDASVLGKGEGNDGHGHVLFNARRENQRPALLLSRGIIYVAFASYCDKGPYHGWVLGYDAATLKQALVFNDTPDGTEGGIWQSGAGPAADAGGNLYFVTGNGTFDAVSGGRDLGDSFVRLTSSGTVVDYFTPHDQQSLSEADLDIGSAGHILLPDQFGPHPHLIISAGKNSALYLVDRDRMGHYNANNDDQIVESIQDAFSPEGFAGGAFTAPVFWNDMIYFGAVGTPIEGFRLKNGVLTRTPVTHSAANYPFPGAAMTVSSNGVRNGILWAVEMSTSSAKPTILHAYDAENLQKELYRSDLAGSRDELDVGVKFASPMIANGKVYVRGQHRLTVLGFR